MIVKVANSNDKIATLAMLVGAEQGKTAPPQLERWVLRVMTRGDGKV